MYGTFDVSKTVLLGASHFPEEVLKTVRDRVVTLREKHRPKTIPSTH